MAHVVGQLNQLIKSLPIPLSKQPKLHRHPEEGSNIVPIFLDGLLRGLLVHIPELFDHIGENVELLVVGVFIQGGLSLKAIYDQFKADLGVLHADGHIFLKEVTEPLAAEPHSLLVQKFDVLLDLTLIEIQKLSVRGVKEPILSLIA